MAIDGKAGKANDELKGRSVNLEVHLRSGGGKGSEDLNNAHTLMYWGTYCGTSFIGTQEMVVLEKAGHYSRSGIFWGEKTDPNKDRIESLRTYVTLNDIISVDVKELNVVNPTSDDDSLEGKKVRIEVHLRSGVFNDGSTPARTLIYWGTYHGTSFIGAQEMVVLEDSGHYNRASIFFGTDNKSELLKSQRTYIALQDIISVDVIK